MRGSDRKGRIRRENQFASDGIRVYVHVCKWLECVVLGNELVCKCAYQPGAICRFGLEQACDQNVCLCARVHDVWSFGWTRNMCEWFMGSEHFIGLGVDSDTCFSFTWLPWVNTSPNSPSAVSVRSFWCWPHIHPLQLNRHFICSKVAGKHTYEPNGHIEYNPNSLQGDCNEHKSHFTFYATCWLCRTLFLKRPHCDMSFLSVHRKTFQINEYLFEAAISRSEYYQQISLFS